MTDRPILRLNLKPKPTNKESPIPESAKLVKEDTQKRSKAKEVTVDKGISSAATTKPRQPIPYSHHYEKYLEILKLVQTKFPSAFPSSSKSDLKPLAMGIFHDLAEQLDVPKIRIRRFLNKYCNTKRYREAHQINAPRYNLAGEVIGEVTEEQANRVKSRSAGQTVK